ncbi:MAG TPA: hypothetical protein DCR68_06075 [Coprothermobacter sp.]|jgi:hypothetical protein|nr:hypothetical protein [Coprothermobacter sp.]
MTIENILGAFFLLLLPLFFTFVGLFLVGVFQWLGSLSKPTHQHVPFWKPFTDVVAFFKEPSTDLGWLPNVLFVLALAVPVFLVWLLPFASVPTMAVHGDLLVVSFGLFASTLLMDLAERTLRETSDNCQHAHGWSVWAVDLSLILVAFVVAATVGSLKLIDIVNMQWGDILSGSSPSALSFKDWLIGKLPLAGLLGIVSLGVYLANITQLFRQQYLESFHNGASKYAGMKLLTFSLNVAVRLILYSILFLGPGSVLVTTLKVLIAFVPAALVGMLVSMVSSAKLMVYLNTLLVVLSFISLVFTSL